MKYYIWHKPSYYGMGSNVDAYLISEDDLECLIKHELTRKRNDKRFDGRLTGAWNEEIFCDSPDEKEVIADVLKKRTTTCSTYADVYDLITIPESAIIKKEQDTLEKKVFRVFNPWGYQRDIITGEAIFNSYLVDFGTPLILLSPLLDFGHGRNLEDLTGVWA